MECIKQWHAYKVRRARPSPLSRVLFWLERCGGGDGSKLMMRLRLGALGPRVWRVMLSSCFCCASCMCARTRTPT